MEKGKSPEHNTNLNQCLLEVRWRFFVEFYPILSNYFLTCHRLLSVGVSMLIYLLLGLGMVLYIFVSNFKEARKKTVLRIHDILVWIRIWIRGYIPVTNGSGSGS